MVSVVSIVEGFILAIIFTVILEILGVTSVLGLTAPIVGFLIAGISLVIYPSTLLMERLMEHSWVSLEQLFCGF